MRRRLRALSAAAAVAFSLGCAKPEAARNAQPASPPAWFAGKASYPIAPPHDIVETMHGVRVSDPYRWLEDARNAEVDAWFHDEDRFARAALDRLPERAAIAARLRELYSAPSRQHPVHAGSGVFFLQRDASHDRARVLRQPDDGSAATVVIDPNGWGEDNIGDFWPSADGARIVYEVKHHNADAATLRIVDVASGAVSAVDVIEGAEEAGPQWTPGGDAF
ncbi:MAG: hypothetical protein FWD17_15225, partial [Polyangiaceae bacterium]|nr:hypothetical protein [Polyangiaceae bacterium]